MIPTIETYCSNTTAANAQCVTVGGRCFFFSYRTLVAVQDHGRLIVRRNEWGPTTGKHLNAIDGGSPEAKRARLAGSEFFRAVNGGKA